MPHHDQFDQLKGVPWQYAVTLTFTDEELGEITHAGQLADPGHFIYKQYVRPLATGLGYRVGAASVFVEGGYGLRPHVHLLLIGKNQKGRTLADENPLILAQFWPYGMAKAEPVTNNSGAVDYLAQNCGASETVNYHGQKMLNEWNK